MEVGRLFAVSPFAEKIKIFMTEEPRLQYHIRNIPSKVERLIKLLSLERISELLVMPNHIQFLLPCHNFTNYFPPGVIFIHVVEAQDLPNKEAIRQSDPFCVVRLGNQKTSTPTVKNDLNPLWKFKTQMICFEDPREGDYDISFTIFDENVFFDDFMFRGKLSVRRVMEELHADEWIENERQGEEENCQGKLRIQAFWQNLSEKSGLFSKHTNEEASTTDDLRSEGENPSRAGAETASSGSKHHFSEEISSKDQTHESAKAVLMLWIEAAQNLLPAWEDFQVEINLYDGCYKTGFASRDAEGKWPFRRRFLFLVKDNSDDKLNIQILPRAKKRCVAQMNILVSDLRTKDTARFNDFYFDESWQLARAFVKIAFAMKLVDDLSPNQLQEIRNVEMEASCSSVRCKEELDWSCNQELVNVKSPKTGKTPSMFTFTEISWDFCPSFALSKPLKLQFGRNSKKRDAEPRTPMSDQREQREAKE